MKKLISILLVILMVLPLVPVSAAYEPQFEYEAQMLYDLGLFKGTDKGFELDKKCDRVQAAVLFIRLLGKEEEALNNPKPHPFTDVPEWASPYIGQMYHDGYTKGISATEYGVGEATATQFATFCLRALGYKEVGYNELYTWYYSYEQALEKMLEVYLIREDSYNIIKSNDVFLRDHAVKIAYNSLFDQINESKHRFLIRRLIEQGVVDEDFVKNNDFYVEENIRYLYSVESFTPYFENMIREATSENKIVSIVNKHETKLMGELDNNNPDTILKQDLLYETAGGALIQQTHVMADDLSTRWRDGYALYTRTTINPTHLEDAMTYRCIRHFTHGDVDLTDTEKKVVEKSEEFLSTITDDMSDYDKFKAAYDFIAKNIKYSKERSRSGNIDVLVDGYAVCQGYATTYLYLCRLMGLECWYVGGRARNNGGGHAWNKVKLDGKYYNIDSTWGGEKYFLFKDLPERIINSINKLYDFPCTEDYIH